MSSKQLIQLKYIDKLQWDEEDFKQAKAFIQKINDISQSKLMNMDLEGLNEFEYFLANNNKILIPTIGLYSSGKSTLLNLLIGEDYLPTGEGVCTNKGVIIEYTSAKNIAELYKIKVKLENNYCTFQKSELICNNKDEIWDKIEEINKKNKPIELEDSFLLLKVYIEFFEVFKDEKIKDKILLIDFPGLGVLKNKNYFKDDVFGKLINQSDSFLFFNPQVINTEENSKIIIDIVNKIKNRNVFFDYKNCLFIMNKWDEHRDENDKYCYSIDKAKNDLKSIFEKNDMDKNIFPDIDIINCSANDYNNYLCLKEQVLNFDEFFSELINDFIIEYKKYKHKENNDINKSVLDYINKKIKIIVEDLLEYSNNNNIQNFKDGYKKKLTNLLKKKKLKIDDVYIENIIKLYIKIVNNIDNHKLLLFSNIKNLKEKIKFHIESSISNVKNNIEQKGINFIRNINDTIRYILNRLEKPSVKIYKEPMDKREKINKEFENFNSNIKTIYNNYLADQDNFINSYIRDIDNIFMNRQIGFQNVSNKTILGRIENEKIEEMQRQKYYFYKAMNDEFKRLVETINKIIREIKTDINMDEIDFSQSYFETAEVGADNINNSNIWRAVIGILRFFGFKNYSEYLLHKNVLFDDRETIINNSKRNFEKIKQQNRDVLSDYLAVLREKLGEFKKEVNKEVGKMMMLNYVDYTNFKENSTKIINESVNEFNDYLKKKFNTALS